MPPLTNWMDGFKSFPWKKMFFWAILSFWPPAPPPSSWMESVCDWVFSPSPDRFQFDFNWIVVCHMKVKVFDKMLFRQSSFFWILLLYLWLGNIISKEKERGSRGSLGLPTSSKWGCWEPRGSWGSRGSRGSWGSWDSQYPQMGVLAKIAPKTRIQGATYLGFNFDQNVSRYSDHANNVYGHIGGLRNSMWYYGVFGCQAAVFTSKLFFTIGSLIQKFFTIEQEKLATKVVHNCTRKAWCNRFTIPEQCCSTRLPVKWQWSGLQRQWWALSASIRQRNAYKEDNIHNVDSFATRLITKLTMQKIVNKIIQYTVTTFNYSSQGTHTSLNSWCPADQIQYFPFYFVCVNPYECRIVLITTTGQC